MNKKLLYKIIFFTIFIISWEITYRSGIYSPLIFPSISEILSALKSSVIKGELIQQIGVSIWVILKGLLVGSLLALVLTGISRLNVFLDEMVNTLITIAHPLPGVALLPIFILWFGVGYDAVFAVIIHSVLWPLLINLKSGIESTPKIYNDVSISFEFKLIDKFKYIYLPSSAVHIISGLKIGWARGWRALISAEMIFGAINATGGIGWFIFERRVFMDTAGIFAGLLVIIIIGIIVEDVVFNKLQKMTIVKWGCQSEFNKL